MTRKWNIKPCPFCGHTDTGLWIDHEEETIGAYCKNCNARGGSVSLYASDSDERLKELCACLWNARTREVVK